MKKKSIARIAVERYRDVLANVTRSYAAQMAARPLDPIPLTASEQWLINDARQTAEDAVQYEREHQNHYSTQLQPHRQAKKGIEIV